ncbi:hypothetical protein SeMB42_g02167 [Synchytrium endobioticum]|uniref:Hypervirulence associated protein TUDOR domain-containing protein n=1 Tax=Synchytrium endobioticum TaxID=286115 RepID=A0A507CVP7_9FUNG|nr:hypothetical protein SeLEV6574_g05163 [Synchytrium endobioticum]TPX50722.1 hypothetical protein SeMB42_g02167 [Synchytrium endobioticum]
MFRRFFSPSTNAEQNSLARLAAPLSQVPNFISIHTRNMSERPGHVPEDHHHGTPRPGSQIEKEDVEIKKGHRYEYHGIEGSMQTSTGVVIDILTQPDIAGSTHKRVKASEEEPRYVIRNDHTGKETAYYKRAFEREVSADEDIKQYHK